MSRLILLLYIFFTNALFSAEWVSIKARPHVFTVIVPQGHTLTKPTLDSLQEILQGNFNQTRIFYAGPFKNKDHKAFKQKLACLEVITQTPIEIIDPALRLECLDWNLEANLVEATQCLNNDKALLITPASDTSFFAHDEKKPTLRVTALEILSSLTRLPQYNSSTSNFEKVIGGVPFGGRLATPIYIGEDPFYVYFPTELLLPEAPQLNSIPSRQNLVDLWQILLGNPFEPSTHEESHRTLSPEHLILFDWLMSLEEKGTLPLAS